jgi:2-keto-4-pentenoate hydratase/2-oxohepta-3-ene-1,7-dioic acid hydratase in catechol pathway
LKLATFTHDGTTRIGVITDGAVLDLAAAAPELPREMCAFLAAGADALERARKAAGGTAGRIPLDRVKIEAPILHPPEFLAIGLNYADHIEESKMERPKFPLFFNKQSSCVTGPTDPIHLPRVSKALDYEGELGFVIGRTCRHVPRDRAHEVIAGYFVVNDVSVRDWQFKAQAMTLGKSFDTHGGSSRQTRSAIRTRSNYAHGSTANCGSIPTLATWYLTATHRLKRFRLFSRCYPERSSRPELPPEWPLR